MPRAPRQGRLAPQHARVPAQRHSPTHVHVLAHVQQAIHELGRELLSLSLWPSPSLVCSVLLDRRSPIAKSGALSLRAPMYARERTSLHIYAPYSRSRSFAVDFYFRLDFPGPEAPRPPFYDLPHHFASHSIPEDELTSNPIESVLLCSIDVASTLFGYLKPFISSGDSRRRFMGRPKRLSRFGRLWSDVFVESSIDALFESYRSRCYRTTDIDEFRRNSKVRRAHVIF